MTPYATDTHPLVWALSSDPRLSPAAQVIFADADAGNAVLLIPPIVAIEMIYLSERGRIPAHLIDDLLSKLSIPGQSYQLTALDAAVVNALRTIPRHLIPEMPDRIIAATALAHNCPLLTRDVAITSSGVISVIW